MAGKNGTNPERQLEPWLDEQNTGSGSHVPGWGVTLKKISWIR
ncbi:MAG: hypothetical protein U5L09_22840 [Bacteroidales bacterium]|nr:hypothetical protein [Bacteroidales bacterium]